MWPKPTSRPGTRCRRSIEQRTASSPSFGFSTRLVLPCRPRSATALAHDRQLIVCLSSLSTSFVRVVPFEVSNVGEEKSMAKFITIGYGDQAGYVSTSREIRDEAHAHDARLRSDGADMGVAGEPVQVRNHDGAGVRTENGPFMHSSLPVVGFAVIEAPTMAEAVEMVSRTPCAVARGVVEIWPFDQTPD
jgi:hypothetical protein